METPFDSGYTKAMEDLVYVVQQLSLARSLTTIMEIVRRAARRLTGADGATFVLRDGTMSFYADEDAISPLWKGQRFPMNICISGWVMIHRTSAMIEDVYADSRIPANIYRLTFVKSLAMVPIRTADPLGAIGIYWSTPHRATPEELRLLQALANTTAVAMENIQLYEEMEYRVRKRTAELQAILDNVPVGIAFALDDRVVRTNPKTAEILGFDTPEVLIRQYLRTLLNSPYPDRSLIDQAEETLSEGLLFSTEAPLIREDGSQFWSRIVAKPLEEGGTLWMIEDISHAKEREQMMIDLSQTAEELTRLKSEGLLLLNLGDNSSSKENGRSEGETGKTGGNLQRNPFESVNGIFDCGKHLQALIHDVLDLSRIEDGKLVFEGEMTDIPTLLENSLSIIREKATANRIRLKTEIVGSFRPAWLDPRKCRLILYNLVSNAVKFTPANGEIRLSARVMDHQEAEEEASRMFKVQPQISTIKAPRILEISLQDTGIGMSEESMARLFRPFSQSGDKVSNPVERSGLGLVLIKKLTELQGGAVGLSSRPGSGSTFSVWLPLLGHPPTTTDPVQS